MASQPHGCGSGNPWLDGWALPRPGPVGREAAQQRGQADEEAIDSLQVGERCESGDREQVAGVSFCEVSQEVEAVAERDQDEAWLAQQPGRDDLPQERDLVECRCTAESSGPAAEQCAAD